MKLKFTRFFSLIVVMFTMSLPTMASSYYSKVVATAVGDGKVYASTSKTNSPACVAGSSSATNNGQAQDPPTHTYYVYAQANAGNEFVGWYDNAQCSGTPLSTSTSSPYEVKFTASSTDENSPTTTTVYAKFRKVGAPVLNYGTSHAYANISAGTYKNETLTTENVTEAITYESSNENVATVAADGTVTAKKNGSCLIKAKSGEGEASYILTVIDDVAAGVTQIGNGDFEDWRGVTSSNHAPNNWNSFETVDGSSSTLIGFAKGQQVSMMEGGRPGSDGLYYADIYSRSVAGGLATAQGNLTLGCIYAGNTSAAHADNHNYSNVSNSAQSETISKIPSAIKVWVKFTPVNSSSKARLAATVHDEYNYITYGKEEYDTDENKEHALAQAALNFSACDWTELTIPFEPTGNTTDGQMYIVVNLTTNSVPGQGDVGDHLYIDDIELVYPEVEPVVYDKYIGVAVNGVYSDPVAAPIEVTYNEDSTIDFNLKNFSMTLGSSTAYVGNISLPGLAMDEDGNFSFDGTIQIAAGDKEGVAANEWIGPDLGDIPVELTGTITDDYFYVHIDITMTSLNQQIEVEVGDLANATVVVSSALVSTFCAPFSVAIPVAYQSAVTASTVTGVNNNNVLTLEPVANHVIPANTPVVIEAPMAATLPVRGIFVKGNPTVGLLTGVYEPTDITSGYVLQNLDNKVAFYQVSAEDPITVPANRCYLTATAGSVKALAFPDGTLTSISEIQAADEKAVIYDLSGRRVSKATKGIYIINGKKVIK